MCFLKKTRQVSETYLIHRNMDRKYAWHVATEPEPMHSYSETSPALFKETRVQINAHTLLLILTWE